MTTFVGALSRSNVIATLAHILLRSVSSPVSNDIAVDDLVQSSPIVSPLEIVVVEEEKDEEIIYDDAAVVDNNNIDPPSPLSVPPSPPSPSAPITIPPIAASGKQRNRRRGGKKRIQSSQPSIPSIPSSPPAASSKTPLHTIRLAPPGGMLALVASSSPRHPHPLSSTTGALSSLVFKIDSGATNHFTTGDTMMLDALLNPSVSIKVANGESLVGQCSIGTLRLKTKGGTLFALNNVVSHPGMSENLISISQMVKGGERRAVMDDKSCRIIDKNGQTILEAFKIGNLYILHVDINTDNPTNRSYLAFSSVLDNYNSTHSALSTSSPDHALWHSRMCHLSHGGIKKSIDAKAIGGIEKWKTDAGDQLCEGCMLGKSHRLRFMDSIATTNKATFAMERFHSDLLGPLTESAHNAVYMLLIIDEYTRFVAIYNIKKKSDTRYNLEDFITESETRHNRKLVELHTDGGGEFNSNALKEYLRERGTILTNTPAYTPQRNGIAERMNRTIIESARSMMHECKAPPEMWSLATKTAVYVKNRCSLRVDSTQTPYQMWTNKTEPTNIHALRVFGCDAWVLTADKVKNNRGTARIKLDAKGEHVIFVGYAELSLAYVVMNMNGELTASKHVRFEEGHFTMMAAYAKSLNAAERIGHRTFNEEIEAVYISEEDQIVQAVINSNMEELAREAEQTASLLPPPPVPLPPPPPPPRIISPPIESNDDRIAAGFRRRGMEPPSAVLSAPVIPPAIVPPFIPPPPIVPIAPIVIAIPPPLPSPIIAIIPPAAAAIPSPPASIIIIPPPLGRRTAAPRVSTQPRASLPRAASTPAIAPAPVAAPAKPPSSSRPNPALDGARSSVTRRHATFLQEAGISPDSLADDAIPIAAVIEPVVAPPAAAPRLSRSVTIANNIANVRKFQGFSAQLHHAALQHEYDFGGVDTNIVQHSFPRSLVSDTESAMTATINTNPSHIDERAYLALDREYGRTLREQEMVHSYNAYAATMKPLRDPLTWNECMQREDAAEWKDSAQREFDSLQKHGVWKVIPGAPPGRPVIGCKMVFKIKLDANGDILKYKCRVVAKGFAQREGIDYNETFAPVLHYKTLRLLLSLVASLDYEMLQGDVPTAFLNAVCEEEVYMHLPDALKHEYPPGSVCRLLKTLYGIKQAPRAWNQDLNTAILALGYNRCIKDSCVYTKMSRSGKMMILPIFVDDVFPMCAKEDLPEMQIHINELMRKYEIPSFDNAEMVLGMRITRDRSKRTLILDQELYISQLLIEYGMDNCKFSKTPASLTRGKKEESQRAAIFQERDDPTIDEPESINGYPKYGSLVGALMYAAISTRPDIAHSVSFRARHLLHPTHFDWIAAKRILHYLAGTAALGIKYGGDMNCTTAVLNGAFCDANWGGEAGTDRKSTSGYAIKMNGGVISWGSKKQGCVAQSSAEAEYYAAATCTTEVLWARQLLGELGFPQTTPTIIRCDNQPCVNMTDNDVHHDRTKHIDIKHHFIRDHVQKGDVKLLYIPTERQQADVFTKALGFVAHQRITNALMKQERIVV